ncbi:MAG: RNA methyltransferase [Sneathiellaceae bacterium]
MRGYFGIGVEGLSKAMNAGNLFRTAHAFGASFVFTINARYSVKSGKSDTSRTPLHVPWHSHDTVADMVLPEGCELVGIEFLDEAAELPSFHHPAQAAYVLGPERGSLSPELLARCQHLVRIPTRFCVNLGTAGAIVMYDRMLTHGRFAERPISSLAQPAPRQAHIHGGPRMRRRGELP